MNKAGIAAIAAAIAVVGISGCGNSKTSSVQNDQVGINNQLDIYERNQPMPRFDYSQYRQSVIDVETAEANGVATTSFFMNAGVKEPDHSCPSIGFPVPITSQLTNPTQIVGGGGSTNEGVPVGQAEPNGTYTGESSGTYVVCVTPSGAKFYDYWEGNVETVGAPAHWDNASGITLDGAPTVKVKTVSK